MYEIKELQLGVAVHILSLNRGTTHDEFNFILIRTLIFCSTFELHHAEKKRFQKRFANDMIKLIRFFAALMNLSNNEEHVDLKNG